MRMFKLMLLVALSLFLTGCPRQAVEPTTDTAMVTEQPAVTDTAAARRDIEQIRDQWVAAAERDDAAAVTAFYTDDAVVTAPDTPAAEGRQAIQDHWARNFPISSALQVRSSETEISGDLAYDYGEFSQRITPPRGKAMDVQGRYVVVLKRQADGAWKIDKHLSFPLQPPAAPRAR